MELHSRNEEMALRWFGGETEMHGAWSYAALGTWKDIPFTACSCWNPLCSRCSFGPLSQDCAEEEGWVSPLPPRYHPDHADGSPSPPPRWCARGQHGTPSSRGSRSFQAFTFTPAPYRLLRACFSAPAFCLKEPPLHHLSVRKANSKGLSQYEFLLFLFI